MLSGGSHGETNEILASLIGHTTNWLDVSSTQDVCYPNKKGVYSCQHNAGWLFRSQAIRRKAAAPRLGPPKGKDQVENCASLP